MSARLTLHALLCSGGQEDCSLVDTAYEAVKREVLREAAEKIRTEPPPADLDGRFGPYINAWLDGQSEAADLIDPDKEN